MASAGGGMVELCGCGTLAIGRCLECGTWVCGTHSRLYGGRRLCDRHWGEALQIDNQRIAMEEKRSVDAFDQMLDSFVTAAAKVGNPGLTKFRLTPDKGWKATASQRGWLILPTRAGFEGKTAETHFLLPDRSVTVVAYTVTYISTGYQEGHYDRGLRRSTGMRSGFRDPVFIKPEERAHALRGDSEEITRSLVGLAAKHGIAWEI